MTAAAVFAEIERVLPFIRGVTVSGGECTLHRDFLAALGGLVKQAGRTFFLDTNGTCDIAADSGLLDVVDGVMPDIKADPENAGETMRVTGGGGFDALAVAEALARRGKLYEVRTVVTESLFDAAPLVEKVCRRLAGSRFSDGAPLQYKLISYRPVGVRPAAASSLAVPAAACMTRLARICAEYGLKAVVV
jgi:pyruvate formate lyase activating enzyme